MEKKLEVFFGDKKSPTDQVEGQHYMMHLAQKFGFTAHPIGPVYYSTNSSKEISASRIILNPYSTEVKSAVAKDIQKYVMSVWQRAYEEDALTHEVDASHDEKAYQRFLKDFQKDGKVLIILDDCSIDKVSLEAMQQIDVDGIKSGVYSR